MGPGGLAERTFRANTSRQAASSCQCEGEDGAQKNQRIRLALHRVVVNYVDANKNANASLGWWSMDRSKRREVRERWWF